MTKVFVSHSTEDRPEVERLIINPLEDVGISTWYSKETIQGGEEWQVKIVDGLESSEYFLVALSENAVNSRWVRSEVFWALGRRVGKFIPVVLSQCNLERIDLRLPGIQSVPVHNRAQIFAFFGVTSAVEVEPAEAALSSWLLVRPLMKAKEFEFLRNLLAVADQIRATAELMPKDHLTRSYGRPFSETEIERAYVKLVTTLETLATFTKRAAVQEEPIWKLIGRVGRLWTEIGLLTEKSVVWTDFINSMELDGKLLQLRGEFDIVSRLYELQVTLPNNSFDKPSFLRGVRNFWFKR